MRKHGIQSIFGKIWRHYPSENISKWRSLNYLLLSSNVFRNFFNFRNFIWFNSFSFREKNELSFHSDWQIHLFPVTNSLHCPSHGEVPVFVSESEELKRLFTFASFRLRVRRHSSHPYKNSIVQSVSSGQSSERITSSGEDDRFPDFLIRFSCFRVRSDAL